MPKKNRVIHKMILLVSNDTSVLTPPVNQSSIKSVLGKALKKVAPDIAPCEISLTFVDDSDMRKLNMEYRGMNRTTDVLSFPQFESVDEIEPGPDGNVLLGDIVISLETLYRRCKSRMDDPATELSRQLIHGILHLLGYDHVTSRERDRMRALEDTIIDTISRQAV